MLIAVAVAALLYLYFDFFFRLLLAPLSPPIIFSPFALFIRHCFFSLPLYQHAMRDAVYIYFSKHCLQERAIIAAIRHY